MLLELAVGDAYGAGFEYDNANVAKYNDLSRYVQHSRHTTIHPGSYTDDTQMSIAITELIVEGAEWTPLNIAQKFVEVFKRDERTGYSSRFYGFLQSVESGEEFLARMEPASDKSGASMRAAPLGIFPTTQEVLKKTAIQAKLTHNTPDGIRAAQAAALMSHYFLYQLGKKEDVGRFLEQHVPGAWNADYVGKVKSKGWMSVRAAITVVRHHTRLSDMLRASIAFTGDVDTVAAIALGCAAHCPEIEHDLPDHLVAMLENSTYGREYIQALDARWLALKR
jgi:ADP-ribosyl-[dinitrogen reductase] hydrolase